MSLGIAPSRINASTAISRPLSLALWPGSVVWRSVATVLKRETPRRAERSAPGISTSDHTSLEKTGMNKRIETFDVDSIVEVMGIDTFCDLFCGYAMLD